MKTSYRLVLDSDLLSLAHAKARSEDLTLAQVLRRLLAEWVGEKPLDAITTKGGAKKHSKTQTK